MSQVQRLSGAGRLTRLAAWVFMVGFWTLSSFAEEGGVQNLQKAEAELKKVYAEVAATLDAAQKEKLEAAQKAWEKYRDLAMVSFMKRAPGMSSCRQGGDKVYSDFLVWSRVSHLDRMRKREVLSGIESEFSDADSMMNAVYNDRGVLLATEIPVGVFDGKNIRWVDGGRPEACINDSRSALASAQAAWERYRDATVEAESSVCSSPASGAILIRTELTYEQALLLRSDGLCLLPRLLVGPPNLRQEVFLAQLFSEDTDIRKHAVDFFSQEDNDSFPLLVAQLKTGMFPDSALPIFEKRGKTVISPLLAEADNIHIAEYEDLPKILAAVGPEIVPPLIERIRPATLSWDSNPRSQRQSIFTSIIALRALAELGPRANEALPSVLQYVVRSQHTQDQFSEQRAYAARAAACIAPDNPEVIRVVTDYCMATAAIDEMCAGTFVRLGSAAKEVLPAMIQASRTPKGYGGAILLVEHTVTSEDSALVPLLIDGLITPSIQYPDSWCHALAIIGEPSVRPLVKLLREKDPVVVTRAATALMMMKQNPKKVVKTLLAEANTEDAFVTIFVIDILGKFQQGGREAIPQLVDFYHSDRVGVSAAALHALHEVAPDSEEVRGAWPTGEYVFDPYYDKGCYRMPNAAPGEWRPYYQIEADFNNDGSMDVAIGDATFGEAGGGWTIYLKESEHRFKRLGHFGIPNSATLYTSKEVGAGYLYVADSANEIAGFETLFKITFGSMDMVKNGFLVRDKQGIRKRGEGEELPLPGDAVGAALSPKPVEREWLSLR